MKPTPLSNIMRPDPDQQEDVVAYMLKEVSPSSQGKADDLPDSIGGQLSVIEREAYERGFLSGQCAGRELGLKEIEAAHQVFFNLLNEAKELKQELLKTADRDILKIALAVARRILRQEIRQSPEKILEDIHTAIKIVGQSDTLLLRIHPDDLERLTKERAKLIQWAEGVKWLRFEADTNLLPGECIIESRERVVDMRIDAQITALCQEMERTAGDR